MIKNIMESYESFDSKQREQLVEFVCIIKFCSENEEAFKKFKWKHFLKLGGIFDFGD